MKDRWYHKPGSQIIRILQKPLPPPAKPADSARETDAPEPRSLRPDVPSQGILRGGGFFIYRVVAKSDS